MKTLSRILPVVAAQGSSVYVISGADLYPGDNGTARRQFLADAYRYEPGVGWTAVTGPPHAVVAAPGIAVGDSHIAVFSGDDGSLFGRTQELGDDHPGFGKTTLWYHTITDTWAEGAPAPRRIPPPFGQRQRMLSLLRSSSDSSVRAKASRHLHT